MGCLKLTYREELPTLRVVKSFSFSEEKSSTGVYRYGFQGQEMDNEISGTGNMVNYDYRMANVRLGRFMSTDPIASTFPHNSPFAFSENRVIDGIELEGLEWLPIIFGRNHKTRIQFTSAVDGLVYTIELNEKNHNKLKVFRRGRPNSRVIDSKRVKQEGIRPRSGRVDIFRGGHDDEFFLRAGQGSRKRRRQQRRFARMYGKIFSTGRGVLDVYADFASSYSATTELEDGSEETETIELNIVGNGAVTYLKSNNGNSFENSDGNTLQDESGDPNLYKGSALDSWIDDNEETYNGYVEGFLQSRAQYFADNFAPNNGTQVGVSVTNGFDWVNQSSPTDVSIGGPNKAPRGTNVFWQKKTETKPNNQKSKNPRFLCFIGSTQIVMKDGSSTIISKINIGDTIINSDGIKLNKDIVLKIDSAYHNDIVELVFNDETVNRNTFDHPYFVKGKGWSSYSPEETFEKYGIKAKLLETNDVCLKHTPNGLIEVKLISIDEKLGDVMTYNISLLKNGTSYFANGILVNNESIWVKQSTP